MNKIRIATGDDFDECRHREYPYVADQLLEQSIHNEWVYLMDAYQGITHSILRW